MSREIKFRAWDGKQIQHNISHLSGLRCPVKTAEADFEEMTAKVLLIDSDYNKYPIMQYTGLKDKNGKEIYEGDKITFPWISPMGEAEDEHSYYGVVVFDEGSFRVKPIKSDSGYWHWQLLNSVIKQNGQIIGNIYENPELLGETK